MHARPINSTTAAPAKSWASGTRAQADPAEDNRQPNFDHPNCLDLGIKRMICREITSEHVEISAPAVRPNLGGFLPTVRRVSAL